MAPPSWEALVHPDAHVDARDVGDKLRELEVPHREKLPWLAGVRNPWDWYVSFYFFMEQHYQNRTGGFSEPYSQWGPSLLAWERHLSRGNDVEGFRKALPVLVSTVHRDEDVIRSQQRFVAIDDKLVVRPIRFERLREGFVEALTEVGAEITPQMKAHLMGRPPQNASGHARYNELYNPELRALVESYDGWLIDTLRYTFS
jgi:hypothetical protein